MVEGIVFWLLFALVVAIIASNRGRSGFLWFLLSVVISPLLALILVLVLPNHAYGVQVPSQDTHKKCPDCAELVLQEAKVCKHCGAKFYPKS